MTINIREIMMAGLLLAAAAVMAQPAPVKNAAKAVFTLTTFKADGQLLASSHGVFVDANGTALSDWSSFEGAASAVVIDATGKRFKNLRQIRHVNRTDNVIGIVRIPFSIRFVFKAAAEILLLGQRFAQ